jgi:putative tributyrin esterase
MIEVKWVTLQRIKTVCVALLIAAISVINQPAGAQTQTSRRSNGQSPRSSVPQFANARAGKSVLLSESFAAASLGGTSLPYRILLPVDYEMGSARYPVLYLLHGADGNEKDWTTRTNLAAYAQRYNLIIVMPGVGNSWYSNSAADPKARYEDAIVSDLIPYIDGKYRTIGTWHGRAVAGLSMGGFGATKFALRYPHLFIFAASFSGAFDAPRTNIVVNPTDERSKRLLAIFGPSEGEARRKNDVFELARRIKDGTRVPYLYIATGSGDQLSSVLPANPRFTDILRERKFAFEYHERPGAHDWRFWDAEVRYALERMAVLVPHMASE